MSPRREGRLRWRVALSLAVALFAAPTGLALPRRGSAADEPAAGVVAPRQGTAESTVAARPSRKQVLDPTTSASTGPRRRMRRHCRCRP